MRNLRVIVLLILGLVLLGKYFSVIRMLLTKNVTSFSFALSESALYFHKNFSRIEINRMLLGVTMFFANDWNEPNSLHLKSTRFMILDKVTFMVFYALKHRLICFHLNSYNKH